MACKKSQRKSVFENTRNDGRRGREISKKGVGSRRKYEVEAEM